MEHLIKYNLSSERTEISLVKRIYVSPNYWGIFQIVGGEDKVHVEPQLEIFGEGMVSLSPMHTSQHLCSVYISDISMGSF